MKIGLSNSILRKLFSFLLATLFGSAALAASKPVKVLFIGNSYTHMNDMPKIFEKIAKSKGADVVVEMNAKSNHTFKMHSEREDMYESIRKEKWDYIVLQGFSREMSYEKSHIDSLSTPYFDQIIDSIYQNNPCTNVMLYMTWGYENGFSERVEVDSYDKMTNQITKGYNYFSEKYDISISPVGHVWREIRSSSDIHLYQPDHQHPTYAGSYITACTFFASIFKDSPFGAFSGVLKGKDAELIQTTAYNYVSEHMEPFKLNRSYAIVKPMTGQGRKEYLVDVEAFYPNAKSIIWNFGDGTSSDSLKIAHKYEKLGEYDIELIIEDLCGPRVYTETVSFKKSRKPWRRKSKDRPKDIIRRNRKESTNKENSLE